MAFETWRSVVGFEGFYEVSDLGRVRSLASVFKYQPRGQILSALPRARAGYSIVCLAGKRKRLVHRLVMEAFVGLCPRGFEVDHIDNKRDNNELANLRYITVHENRSFPRKLSLEQLSEIKRLRIDGVPRAEVAKLFGVSEVYVSKIIKLKGQKI